MSDATKRGGDPSMDDILSSIRRMISDDRGTPANGFAESRASAGQARQIPVADDGAEERVLEAGNDDENEYVDPLAELGAIRTAAEEAEDEAEEADARFDMDRGLIAEATAAATLASIQALSREVRVSARAEGRTLEDVVESLLRPILKEWLDRHLPGIVQAKVEAEIRRIAERRGR